MPEEQSSTPVHEQNTGIKINDAVSIVKPFVSIQEKCNHAKSKTE
jgi:hypothetical protein